MTWIIKLTHVGANGTEVGAVRHVSDAEAKHSNLRVREMVFDELLNRVDQELTWRESPPERPPNCGTSFCSCVECVVMPVVPTKATVDGACRMRIGQDAVTWYDKNGNTTLHIRESNKVTINNVGSAAAQPSKPLTADDMKEPKNGEQWRVEWWNEFCRMMLPKGMKLDGFTSYKNGTMQFTIKKKKPPTALRPTHEQENQAHARRVAPHAAKPWQLDRTGTGINPRR